MDFVTKSLDVNVCQGTPRTLLRLTLSRPDPTSSSRGHYDYDDQVSGVKLFVSTSPVSESNGNKRL